MEHQDDLMDVESTNDSMQRKLGKKLPSQVIPKSGGPPEIDPSEIERGAVLGDGSFGTVHKGKCRQKDVAVKVLLKQDFDEKALQAFRHEVEVMSKIYHPNINLFMGACTVPGKLMIVTELMRGDLESIILEEHANLSLLQRMKIAKDAALGILWLHSSNPQIIHRDLKASNLLLDDNLTCKICDFGLSQLKPRGKNLIDGSDGAKGTPLWMAPEVMMGESFNEKADVYSFGLILWFLLTTKEPYEEFEDLDAFSRAICLQHVRPKIPEKCDPGLKDLITRCWHSNPSVRPSFSEIVQRIDIIIVDLAIEDSMGRRFWKEFFLTKDIVPWNDFLNAISKLLGLIPPQNSSLPMTYILNHCPEVLRDSNTELEINCLKAILADESKSHHHTSHQPNDDLVVSSEKFGNILQFFGPLMINNPNEHSMIQKIRLLMVELWFHGDISTPESENRLIKKPEGTFLVRFSTSSPGCYTISKVSKTDHTIKHQKIHHVPGGDFEVNGTHYRSLQELIRGESENLHLLYSCGGSRFLPIFVQNKNISGYVN